MAARFQYCWLPFMLSNLLRLIRGGAAVILVLVSVLCAGQSTRTPTAEEKAPATPDCLRRAIPLTVIENPQNAELRATELHIQSKAVEISALSLSRGNLAPRVALLVDTSGSMKRVSGRGWGTGLLAAAFALDTIPQQSPIALVTFDERTRLSTFTDHDAIRQRLLALGHVQPHGRTALFTTIQKTIQLFGAPQFGDSIFVISDTHENVSGPNPRAVADELIQHGIRVFTFVVKNSDEVDSVHLQPDVPFEDFIDFVDSTGGDSLTVHLTPKWLQGKEAPLIFRLVSEELRSPYRLDLELTAVPAKPAKWKISTGSKQLKVSYPSRLEPCFSAASAQHP